MYMCKQNKTKLYFEILMLYFRSAASATLFSVWNAHVLFNISFSSYHLNCMQNGRTVHFLLYAQRTLFIPEEHLVSLKHSLFNFVALDFKKVYTHLKHYWKHYHYSGPFPSICMQTSLLAPSNIADSCFQKDFCVFGKNDLTHSIIQIWIKQAF